MRVTSTREQSYFAGLNELNGVWKQQLKVKLNPMTKSDEKTKYDAYWDICEKESHTRYPYVYDEPCVITRKRFADFERLQKGLYKAFRYFMPRYQEYEDIIEYSPKSKAILSHFDLETIRIGFYRPDFVIPEKGEIKICELGCRYYEAYWGHGHFEYIMEKRCRCSNANGGDRRIIDKVIDGAYRWWTGLDQSLTVLQGRDREGDIRFYRPYFQEMGTRMRYIYPDTLADQLDLLQDGPVLNAFSQMELEELTSEQLSYLAQADCLNPLSTVILLHDKRFLAVLYDDEFREAALGNEEADFMAPFLIPTFTRKQDPAIWEDAYRNKDGYILKPQLLGKSEGIVPGPLVTEAEWKAFFDSEEIETMVLQHFVQQRTFNASIDGKRFQDYGTGILLCLEDELQGLGQFRMSSCEVINYISDDRKMVPWITDEHESYHGNYFLL